MLFREYINDHYQNFCTGCSACVEKCPTKALSLVQDPYGYFVSHYNPDVCVNCNACEKICPVLYPRQVIEDRADMPLLYAVQMEDQIRELSSSGGVFSALAHQILSNKGVVVGCKLTENMSAKHIIIDDEKNLDELRGSKYIQSFLGNTFKEIRKILYTGKQVLFVGTPCQVAGLNAFLGKDYNNLITVDVLCLYAPSPKFLQQYLKEQFPEDQVLNCNFRDKENGWSCDALSVTCKIKSNKIKKIVRLLDFDLYEKSFIKKLLKSDHCKNCIFACHKRQGDLTIGDFWEICALNPSFDNKGTNSVLINSRKGERLFKSVFNQAKKIERRKLKELSGNRIENHDYALPHPQSHRFQQLFLKNGFSKAARECLNNHFDVALVGCYDVRNFGSHLTYYALYQVIKSMGKSVAFIGCPADAEYKSKGKPEYFKRLPYQSYEMISQYADKIDMRQCNDIADAFVVGSDQMWDNKLYKYFGSFGFLDFINENKVKISYATSFGKSEWYGKASECQLISYYLSRFDGVSVRETSGVKICRDNFNIHAAWTLDPVFVCDAQYYKTLLSKSDIDFPKRYIAAYILDCDKDKIAVLKEIAKRMGMTLLVQNDPNIGNKIKDTKISASLKYVEDWLKWLHNATYIITDSFHGMCVSLIFQKQFIAIRNNQRGAARFDDYGEKLKIEDSIKNNFKDLLFDRELFNHQDYQYINNLLNKYIVFSKSWLQNELSIDKSKVPLSVYDIVSMREEKILNQQMQNLKNINTICEKFKRCIVYRGLKYLKTHGIVNALLNVNRN